MDRSCLLVQRAERRFPDFWASDLHQPTSHCPDLQGDQKVELNVPRPVPARSLVIGTKSASHRFDLFSR
ncbi:hypothetical protein KFU94_62575 [Chloroflexi bacterium TSY]|nr:hypothetical protein [Chloroflexi bacterium TSY]